MASNASLSVGVLFGRLTALVAISCLLQIPHAAAGGSSTLDSGGPLAASFDDAEIVVNQEAPGDCGEFESRTVALLNRGVPGFAVERDGTLHTSLMRSCTGWPSGTWIDPPAR